MVKTDDPAFSVRLPPIMIFRCGVDIAAGYGTAVQNKQLGGYGATAPQVGFVREMRPHLLVRGDRISVVVKSLFVSLTAPNLTIFNFGSY